MQDKTSKPVLRRDGKRGVQHGRNKEKEKQSERGDEGQHRTGQHLFFYGLRKYQTHKREKEQRRNKEKERLSEYEGGK